MSKYPITAIELSANRALGTRWIFVAVHRSEKPDADWHEGEHTVNLYPHATGASMARIRRAQEVLVGK